MIALRWGGNAEWAQVNSENSGDTKNSGDTIRNSFRANVGQDELR